MAKRKRSNRNDQTPGWVWMLFGLSVGLAVALFVYLQGGSPAPPPAPSAARNTASPAATPPAAPPAAEPAPPAAASEASAQAEAERTELEFYELLQTLEVSVPAGPQNASRAQQLASGYTIQAGSFRTFDEADSRRATLALLAIDSHIERAIVQNDIWHRVIIGPLSDVDEIDRILRRLRDERIDTLPPRPVAE